MGKKAHLKAERLGVFMNGVMVGTLVREQTGALSFFYDQSWLERENCLPVSRRFLLRPQPYVGKIVRDFFENLLPDDKRIRERIAANTQAEGIQPFDLLSAVGRDCVGALQFYPDGESPGPVGPVQAEALTRRQIADMLSGLRVNPLGISMGKDFRISLAGAQSKTALLSFNGKWMQPKGATPTTHILKPAIGNVPDGPDFSLSVENEWLCLSIVKAFNIPTANAEIAEFNGIKVLVVERFDRKRSGKKIYRIPQEDMCQALGVGPEKKYEADGGPGISDILDLLNESDQRDIDRWNFMKTQIIFWLLGAIDGHAKNFSVFIRPVGFALTPVYDVISGYPHVNKKTFPFEKLRFAMAVGRSRHYKFDEIQPRHWLQTADDSNFYAIKKLISEIVTECPKALERVTKKLPRSFPSEISDPIFRALKKRTSILAEVLP